MHPFCSSFPSSFCFVGFSKQAQPSIPTSHAQGEKHLSRRNTASAQRKYWRTDMAHFCSSNPEVVAAAAGAERSKPSPESCERSTAMSFSPWAAAGQPSAGQASGPPGPLWQLEPLGTGSGTADPTHQQRQLSTHSPSHGDNGADRLFQVTPGKDTRWKETQTKLHDA